MSPGSAFKRIAAFNNGVKANFLLAAPNTFSSVSIIVRFLCMNSNVAFSDSSIERLYNTMRHKERHRVMAVREQARKLLFVRPFREFIAYSNFSLVFLVLISVFV